MVGLIDPTNQPCFNFIRMFMVGLAIWLDRADGLAIDEAVSMEADIAVGFYNLSLW